MYTDPKDKLAAARQVIRRRWPYYSVAVTALVPRPLPGLGTLGVTDGGVLMYDPKTVLDWDVMGLATVLVHEALHLLRRHPARVRSLIRLPELRENLSPEDRDKLKLWNLAGDCEINDDLARAGGKFPTEACLPERFSLLEGLTAEEYYHALIKQAEAQRQQEQAEKEGRGHGQGRGGGRKGRSGQPGEKEEQPGGSAAEKDQNAQGGPGNGRCGSCSGGMPLPGEDQFKGIGRSPAELRRIERQTADAIRQEAQKGWGNMPGGWTCWANAILEPPKIPWQQKLARTVRAAMAYRTGAVDHSHIRLSRRQAGIGYGPGKPVLPALVAPVVKVAVVVDTSGSMGQEQLRAALAETQGVLRAAGGVIDLCVCDAEVHGLRPVQTIQQAADLLKGGGGTDFRPAFDALLQRPRSARPDVVVFLTDGQGPAPAEPPLCRVIWGLIGPHRRAPCTWGEVVEIE